MAAGKSNEAIGKTLFLAERSIEKVIHSIFSSSGSHGSRRSTSVKAVILYLAESD